MPHYVLDASALLTLLHQEPGSDKVVQAIEDGAAISTVNLSEVASKLNDLGAPEMVSQDARNALELAIADFNSELAYKVAVHRPITSRTRLALGDRVCPALAEHIGLPALTTDHAWEGLSLGITV